MKEAFLHYVWRTKQFDLHNLKTTTDQSLQIIEFGQYNRDAGPDFLHAKIKVEGTLWVGHVEMHLQSSEWHSHRHQENPAYENVILHVVLEENRRISYKNGESIPCLELRKRISKKLAANYEKLLNNAFWIPCQHQFATVNALTKMMWRERLVVERLESKTTYLRTILEQNKNDWRATCYQFLGRNFGVPVNADAFERLTEITPLVLLAKHKNSLFQIEALLFGQAGLLEGTYEEEYPRRMQREYQHLRLKYGLNPMQKVQWRFMRMRPASFPSIRIAQFAQLIYQTNRLLAQILEAEHLESLKLLFNLRLKSYWLEHYAFDKPSKRSDKTLGSHMFHVLCINGIVPILFLYGQIHADDRYQKRAIQLLEAIPREQNSIIKQWKMLGEKPQNAYDTQALLQLKKEYCSGHRCLECHIGNVILRRD